jgi:sugar lactone lactonase YvrE
MTIRHRIAQISFVLFLSLAGLFGASSAVAASPQTFASGFHGPYGLAFDSTGNLYVANFNDSTVSKVTLGGTVTTFVSSQLNGPGGLAFDSTGNLYVANFRNSTVSKVTPGGTVSLFASGFANPAGLAFDSTGNLYVTNYNANTVSEVTPGGTVSLFASGFNAPFGLAFDSTGNLYVANYNANTVSEVIGAAPPAPTPVPTLSQWALILMAALMAIGGVLVIDRRRFAFRA